jgi:hypothetical protein
MARNVPLLLVNREVQNFLFSVKVKIFAKRELELTTKFAIARNRFWQ